MKKCFKCQIIKPFTEYYKHTGMADGYLNKCKECNKNDATTYRHKNIEKIREYDRTRGKESNRIKASTEITRAWRAEDNRRSAAHSAVARAIRNGFLVRMSCEKCGEKKSVAHHEDYDKHLEIIWLCQSCHKQRHKEIFKNLLNKAE